MVLKSLKSKIAAGVVGVSLVAGMSTVFAGVDAGTQFKGWYTSLFTNTTAKIQADATSDYAKKIGQYASEYNSLKNSSTKAIKNEAAAATSSAQSEIANQKNTYISQISTAQQNINVAGDFTQFTATVNGTVDNLKGQAKDFAANDLDKTLNAQGTKSVKEVNSQVTTTKNAAKDELAAKINSAKAEIQALVNQQAATADATIRKHIDDQIAALKAELTQYAQDLVKVNKEAVNAEGDKVQQQAFDELEAIAASIK